MLTRNAALSLILLCLFLIVSKLHAQTTSDQIQIDNDLNQQNQSIDVLAGFSSVEAQRRALGLSLGASRVYTKEHGFSVGGYTELLYQKSSDTTGLGPNGSDLDITVPRAVVFLGFRINERLVINSEFRADRDIFDTDSAEASVDLAYLDYILNPAFTLRAGIVLVPMGLVNEFHQPNEYLGTRPGFGDIFTLLNVWHALGFGFAGHKWGFDYRAYVISGLNAAKFNEFGMRDGREITSDTIGSPSVVYRIEYNFFPGGIFGGSYYLGNSGIFGVPNPADLKIHTTIKELLGELRWKGAQIRAQYAIGLMNSTGQLNAILKTTGLHGVGSRVVGGYVEGGYNLLAYKENGKMIMPYMRGEASNSMDALPRPSLDLGLIKNWYVDFIIWIFGVEVRPIPALSIKTEYESTHDQNQIYHDEFHIDVSYAF
ncbi:hypothetical protein L0244_11220 [bacterium]|nr:hypothetical protein [bacterium]